MFGIIYSIIAGLIVGIVARLLKPGADPMGWIGTIVVGILGAFVGGFLASILGLDNGGFMGVVLSVVGAIFILFIYEKVRAKK